MRKIQKRIFNLSFVLILGALPAILCQFFAEEPVSRHIHIRNFRYGKDPAVIRCHRGDTLHLTFSSDDTGHSWFLEEFDVDVKVSPALEEVHVFKTSDPSETPEITRELTLVVRHPGWLNYVVSKSYYRCHVWCGPMHAFEQGKLILLPNTLWCFSLGALAGVLLLWVLSLSGLRSPWFGPGPPEKSPKDMVPSGGRLHRLLVSRWPQLLLVFLALALIYLVLMTSFLGTKMSGRNLGVLMMWAVWLFLIIAVLTPLGGRVWCTVCPLPLFGDWMQRGSLFHPRKGKTGRYNNRFSGLFLTWPARLQNNWLRLVVFLTLATFSTTMVASPKTSGLAILLLLLLPTLMAPLFELRAFCRYVCPVHAFVGPFSGMSKVALRKRSPEVCDKCKAHFCETGSAKGWACPYGLNVSTLEESAACGLCLECFRSCPHDNVTLYRRPFASERKVNHLSDAWLSIGIFTVAIIYSILYLGHWPEVRDYVNILDKKNWDLFGIYALVLWSAVFLVVPGLVYALGWLGSRLGPAGTSPRQTFLTYAASILPFALMLWLSFVLPMFLVNVTFILQSLSDPFGWGWDFFGTASIPWHQVMPRFIPWMQAFALLGGLHLSLRNLRRRWEDEGLAPGAVWRKSLPFALFLGVSAGLLLLFFTN
ncbi:MAG: 4Fe-4S binding protein [Bacteroidales bacterium]